MNSERNPYLPSDFQSEEFLRNEDSGRSPKRIKNRTIRHVVSFGKGTNHPSFFIRKLRAWLRTPKARQVFQHHPRLLNQEIERTEPQMPDYRLRALTEAFGMQDGQRRITSYLSSKLFFQMVKENSLDAVMGEATRCNQILNHLISIEKYSSRLGHPELTGRVQFQ